VKNIYKDYAQLRRDIALFEEREEALRAMILKDMQDNKMVKEEFEFGKFTVGSRKNYTYSKKIKDMEDKVKIAKNKEVEQGKAKAQETNYVVYKPITLE
jgi:hypothetical protein